MAGYIKLHRKLLKWGWYSDTSTFRVFMHLLLTASYEENEFRGHTILPGQVVFGRKQLARDLGLSERAVRTALEHLKSTNELTIKTTNKFSIATIENWAKYQCRDYQNDQQNDQLRVQQPTNNRPTTDHTQEGKESKKIKNKEDIYSPEITEIVDYLNEMTGSRYKSDTASTRKLLTKILETFSLEDVKTVIWKKCREWGSDPKMVAYLRPQTLFGPKFEAYLNQKDIPMGNSTKEGRLDWIDRL